MDPPILPQHPANRAILGCGEGLSGGEVCGGATVAELCNGWYGNVYHKPDGSAEVRRGEDSDFDIVKERGPVDFKALVCHTIKYATKCVSYLPGVSGEV
mmetsp:Transcript_21304/g.61997  ORF Transcript_21304/g.61997 Transcript_21304/m.61997 type:complete len:99 (+) Transcript_21304:809-1105(+)